VALARNTFDASGVGRVRRRSSMTRRVVLVLASLLLTVGILVAASDARADSQTCVIVRDNAPAFQMTSFSVNTGLYSISIVNRPAMILYGYANTYIGEVAIGWIPIAYQSSGVNLGAYSLVMVPIAYVTGQFACEF